MKRHFKTRRARALRPCSNPTTRTIPDAYLNKPLDVALAFMDLLQGTGGTAPAYESLVCFYLDAANHILNVGIQPGTTDSAAAYPRNVVKEALDAGAVSVIIAHNHPSGAVRSSPQDLALTRRVKEALETVDIRLHDHIIVAIKADDSIDYTSLVQEGLF